MNEMIFIASFGIYVVWALLDIQKKKPAMIADFNDFIHLFL